LGLGWGGETSMKSFRFGFKPGARAQEEGTIPTSESRMVMEATTVGRDAGCMAMKHASATYKENRNKS